MYLVDTNVISALAPTKRESVAELIDWLDRASDHLFLSVITAAEVRSGIEKASREGASTKVELLTEWWHTTEYLYDSRILPFDRICAQEAGKMIDLARAHQPGFEDIAIAATAKAHGLTVLTRNLRHFAPLGVAAQNPFLSLPRAY